MIDFTKVITAEDKLVKLIKQRMSSINSDCENAIGQISATYPASEVASWPKQEAEARNFIKNEQAHTPLLNAMAASREIDKGELAARIIAKSDVFAIISGDLIGRRQKLEDELDLISDDPLATPSDVAAIQW